MKRYLAECARESYPLSPRRSTQLCRKIYHVPLRWRILCADGAEATLEDLFRNQLWQIIQMGVVRSRRMLKLDEVMILWLTMCLHGRQMKGVLRFPLAAPDTTLSFIIQEGSFSRST